MINDRPFKWPREGGSNCLHEKMNLFDLKSRFVIQVLAAVYVIGLNAF